jgi:hypothetical protein
MCRCDLEAIGGLVAEELQALRRSINVGPRREAFQFDRADFGAVLLALAAPLRLFVVVELALDPVDGAVEQVDGRPQQIVEVGLEARVAQRRDQGIEDVDDGAGDDVAFGKRPGSGSSSKGRWPKSCSSART